MAAVSGLVLAFGACTSTPATPKTVTVGDAYAAVVRWQIGSVPAPATTTNDKPLVYITRSGGEQITAGEQAAVVAAVKDEAVVRFADVRDEAVDAGVDGKPVKEGGVLLIVGPVPNSQPPVEVQVEVYRTDTDDRTFSVLVDSVTGGVGVTASTLSGSG